MSLFSITRSALLAGVFMSMVPLGASAFNPPDRPDPDPDPPTDPTDPPDNGDATLPPVDSVSEDGPFETTITRNTGPSGSGWVVRPSNLGQDGLDHPIFLWGPGGGTGPAEYEDHLRRIASHGFVVYSEVSSGNGTEMINAMDWFESENSRSSSAFNGHLDMSAIAAGGHSMGSVTTFAAAPDDRIQTTIHVAGGSFDGQGSDDLSKPAAYICGEDDNLATSNCRRDYSNTDNVPVWFTVLADTDHIMAARNGLPQMVAWLRWHLGNETERRSMFIGDNCDFCTTGDEVQYKNW